jgi:hypothetical protein
VKQLATIIFSLLLIVAQTFAVVAPVSSGVTLAKASCCGGECQDCKCCVSESSGPVTPLQSPAPAPAQNQFVFPFVAVAIFTLATPTDELSPASVHAEFRAATPPLFQRNCVFLI